MDTKHSERPGRWTAFVARELHQYNTYIAALQETRRAGEGQLTKKGAGCTFFWKEKEKEENKPRTHGVSFAVKNAYEHIRNVEEFPVGVNEHLITLRLNQNLINKRQ